MNNDASINESESHGQNLTEFETAVNNSFFYTSDKALNAMDDLDVLKTIKEKYPAFHDNVEDRILKQQLIEFLDDEEFVLFLLQYYHIDIKQLFKIICKRFGSIFKGLFLKKVIAILNSKRYDRS